MQLDTSEGGELGMTTPTYADQVGVPIGTAVEDGKEVITDNMPVVFGVAIAFVAWSVGRRVLGKI